MNGKELRASMGLGWLVNNEGVRVTGAISRGYIGPFKHRDTFLKSLLTTNKSRAVQWL